MAHKGKSLRYAVPLSERFWPKVDRTGGAGACWPWKGSRTGGYGRILVGSRSDGTRKVERASRVALELHLGRPLAKGLEALHECDSPPCVNPAHLYEGTQADNAQDRESRDRGNHVGGALPGERHHSARLTAKQVAAIRERYRAGGVSQLSLGAEFNVSQAQIGRIVRGERWQKGLV